MVLASGVRDYGPEDEDDEKQPFYLGKRNNDRRFSMSKEAREHNARQRMLRHVVPTYFTKPFVTVEVDDEEYVSSVREIAVNIPARMHLVVENHKLVNPRVEWRDFDVHFLSGVSRPRFTLRQDPDKKRRFVVEILANLAGHGVFSVTCKGVPVLGSPFQIQAINPSWNSQHSYAEVPAKTHCGDIVRVNIICRDQFGHIFTEAQENVEVAIAGPAVVNKILLQDRSPGVKELVFKATKVGMYTIDITAFGESFRGGPYRVDVMPAAPSPKRTKLSGEGIVKAVAGCVHNFIMEPRDVYDNARKLNKEGEVWHAELVDPDTKTTFPITMEIERKNRKQDIFKCSYRAFKSGIYRISLRVEHSHGKSSHALLPELITVLPGLTSGRKSELRVKASSGYWTQKDDGKRMWCIKAGTSLTINVQACDKYGNKKMRETSELLCRMSYMEQEDADRKPDINIQVINNKNGSYVATLNGTVSGTYMCSVELRAENVGYAPFLLRIEPSTLDIPSCVATGRMNDVIKDGIVGLVGEPNMLLVQAKDCFGNTLERGGHQFVAVLRYQEGQPNESGITHLDPLTFLSKDKDDGTYVFEYKTNISGTYELSIESFSQHVMHSPFPLSMKGQRDIASVLISSTSSLRAVAGNKSTFTVVALDTFQNRQVTGGMMIIPEISLRQDDATRRSPQQAVVKDALIPTQVIDNDDGTYQILYTTDIVGTYEVVIKYMDPSKKYSKPQVVEIIDTGNKELTIVPADVDPESCMIQEAENLNVEAGSEGVFTVVTLDKYGNVVTRGGARVEAHGYKEFLPEGTADIYLECLVTDNDDGTYSVQFKGYQAGTYICEVTIDDVNVKGLEYKVGIVPGLTDPQSCEITGDGLKVGQCGEVAQFTIVSKDKYGNYPDHTNEKFLVYLQPLGFKTKSCTMSEGTTRLRAKTMYKGEGKYTVEYVPRRSCLYELYVFYNPLKYRPSWTLVRRSYVRDEWSSFLLLKSYVFVSPGAAHAPSTTVKGAGLYSTIVNRPGIVHVTIRDKFKQPQVSLEEVRVVTSDMRNADGESIGMTSISQDEKNQSEYTVIYRTGDEGDHTLNIFLNGDHISGSPFHIKILPSDIQIDADFADKNSDLTWDADTALMMEKSRKSITIGGIPAGSAVAAAGYLHKKEAKAKQELAAGFKNTSYLIQRLNTAQLKAEENYSHFIMRKKAMALHSRISTLSKYYETM